MDVSDVYLEMFDRLPDLVEAAVDGLTPEQLSWAPAPGANSIGWLVWHLSRIHDDHLAEVAGWDQVWMSGGWAGRFGLAAGTTETGYGHSAAQVVAVRPDGPEVLVGYFRAVAARTREWLRGLTPQGLDRIVDERWDPPVTLGVRLVSVADDSLQHAGQAAYVRGLLPR